MSSSRKDPEHSEKEEEGDGVAAVLGKAGSESRRERGACRRRSAIREGGEDDPEASRGAAGESGAMGEEEG